MKVLIIGRGYDVAGGVSKYVYNLMMHMDLHNIEVDFIAHTPEEGRLSTEQELLNRGITCYHAPWEIKDVEKYLKQFLKTHNDYDIVHIQVTSGAFVKIGLIAKKYTNAKIIYHSHTYLPVDNKKGLLRKFLYRVTGDYFMACSNLAGLYMFGEKVVKSPRYMVARNGVDLNTFYLNKESRRKIREQYGIGDAVLFGFVGRLSKEKNVDKILESFKIILSRMPQAYLMLVGEGVEQENLEKKCVSLGIVERVIFTGSQKNVSEYMNAFDLLFLPSDFESFGIVLVEAQACGLSCLVSAGVVKESLITELCYVMEKDATIEQWAVTACNKMNQEHVDKREEIEKVGYDLITAVRNVQNFYEHIISEK